MNDGTEPYDQTYAVSIVDSNYTPSKNLFSPFFRKIGLDYLRWAIHAFPNISTSPRIWSKNKTRAKSATMLVNLSKISSEKTMRAQFLDRLFLIFLMKTTIFLASRRATRTTCFMSSKIRRTKIMTLWTNILPPAQPSLRSITPKPLPEFWGQRLPGHYTLLVHIQRSLIFKKIQKFSNFHDKIIDLE